MGYLGTSSCFYEHLLRSGASKLAAVLYAVRKEVDYLFLPPKEASSGEEDVYVAKRSGKTYSKQYPPPDRCRYCKKLHWNTACPEYAAEQASKAERSFPRGKPPARYYVSRSGKVFDTTRKPPSECQKCGKLHWWFACPRGGDTMFIPKGASFTNSTEQKPLNKTSARFKKPASSDPETAAETVSSSSSEELLPQKRQRSAKKPSSSKPAAESPPAPAMPTPQYPPMYPPFWPPYYPPWQPSGGYGGYGGYGVQGAPSMPLHQREVPAPGHVHATVQPPQPSSSGSPSVPAAAAGQPPAYPQLPVPPPHMQQHQPYWPPPHPQPTHDGAQPGTASAY